MSVKGGPIRLRIGYKSASSLLAEFTRSVGRGTVTLESRRALPLGTRFVFELLAEGVDRPVEVVGEVLEVTPRDGGSHALHIRYDPGPDPGSLEALVQTIFDQHRYEKLRAHPRIPLVVHGEEESPDAPRYLVRDVSLSGLGLEVVDAPLPDRIRRGEPFLLELWLSIGQLSLHGEVVWARDPLRDRNWLRQAAFGVQFGKLRPDTVERLEHILHLKALPPPPWRARLSLGMDAVARMP